jgi:hypothetical protein
MATDWSVEEDMQPGALLVRDNPEVTPRGNVYTWLVEMQWPTPSKTQLYVRDCGDILVSHGRIFPLVSTRADEDGA